MVAAAVVGAGIGGALLSSNATRSAANTASNAQKRATQLGIDQQNKQFEAVQRLLSPFVTAGTGSLGAQQNLLGLNGADAQQAAISGFQSSPMFSALARQGEDAILANASATGGLRGGNVQSALGQFRPQLLNQLIQQQLGNLGGLTSLGQNAAAGVGNAGMQTGQGVSSLLQQQGAAQAGNALAAGRAQSGVYNALGSSIGTFAGLGGFGTTSAYDANAARAAASARQADPFASSVGDVGFAPIDMSAFTSSLQF
jgi:hypothetical protein